MKIRRAVCGDYKIIKSKNKKNIRLVAAGADQIEFFEYGGCEYFAIYRPYGKNAHYYLFNFHKAGIAQISDSEFQIIHGMKTYRLRVIEKGTARKVYVSHCLLGWLPLSRLGGYISRAGLDTLMTILKSRAQDLAA